MSEIFIAGLGAVSPAGWGVPALRAALKGNHPLPTQEIARPGRSQSLRVRAVPPPPSRPSFLAHPRLRRTSPITHYAAAAALEALAGAPALATTAKGGDTPAPLQPLASPGNKLGLICCFQSGCVQYSCRFFEEALRDPATASPLAFPETVFAAPTSHIATLLGTTGLVASTIGDPASYLQGVAMAADWLLDDKADLCLVVAAEESHWLVADALWHFQHQAVLSSGAGAICLTRDPARGIGVRLGAITDVHTFGLGCNRSQAAREMRRQLPAGSTADLLCDGLDSCPRMDRAEALAWNDWPGARVSPKRILGEGLMAGAAWQCVAACDSVARGDVPAAMVSLVGCNQQAIGARFVRANQ